jgi:hypothetical protein
VALNLHSCALAEQRSRIWPWVAVGNTTSWDWMRASSSIMERGELPSPVRLCHISSVLEAEAHRGTIAGQAHCEAPGSTLVLLQDAADLSVHLFAVEMPLSVLPSASGRLRSVC